MPAPEISPSPAMPVKLVGTKARKPSEVVAAQTNRKPPTSPAACGIAAR